MSRFTDYTNSVGELQADGQIVWRTELIGPEGELLATDRAKDATGEAALWQVDSDPAQVAADRIAQRSTSAQVASSEIDLVPSERSGILHPNEQPRVRIYSGVKTDSETLWYPKGTFSVETVSATSVSGRVSVIVDLVDAIHPVRSDLVTSETWEEGETVEDVVGRLLGRVLDDDQYLLRPTNYTVLQGDTDEEEPLWPTVNSLLEGCGQELIADPYGLVLSRSILPSHDEDLVERWYYGSGTGFIPVQSALREWPSQDSPSAWQAIGGAESGEPELSSTVYDRDPRSLGFFAGLSRPIAASSSTYPWARTLRQLEVAAYGQMRRSGAGPGIVQFSTAPNPAMEQGDLLQLTLPELNIDGSYRVLGYELPHRNQGLMSVTARAAWDPSQGYTGPGVDVDVTCRSSFSDSFDRADQDLQEIPGATDGSQVWTEIGWSWGVVDRNAVQRYPNGWSLAFFNQALCFTDEYAEMVIDEVPPGRRVGPVIRCDGAFDGYVALVSPSSVSLELWLAGESRSTLGWANLKGTAEGLTVKIQAEGSTISVDLDGVRAITASDTRLTVGAFVGMLGYGGAGDQAPKVRSFAAGAAT